ncbi:MAG: hypothetical protein EOP45_02445 [Sphingobacteriaceae bacterium]|nr:MAG: hypothetical protein EOP45_02445 [Sphingobacteriaceae bacterium]
MATDAFLQTLDSMRPVEGPTATLLARLQAGWSPPPFVLPPIASIKLDGEDITKQLLSIRLDGDVLHLRFRDRKANLFAARNVHARTADGGTLTTRILDSSRQLLFDDPVNRAEVVARCEEWTFFPETAPTLWVASLPAMRELPGPGNLLIRWSRYERDIITSTSLRLSRPGLTSFFVETKQRNPQGEVWLCLDGQTQQNEFRGFYLDLQLFRLLFSTPIKPGIFYGIDSQGQVTGALRVTDNDAAREVSSGLQPPVPITHQQIRANPICIWAAPFYDRLASHFFDRDTANAISFSLKRYMHSLAPIDVDTQYLLVAGALSILLKYLARQPDTSQVVKAAMEADSGQAAVPFLNAKEAGKKEVEVLTSYAKLLGLRTERAMLTSIDPQNGPVIANELIEARSVFERGAFTDPEGPGLSKGDLYNNYNRVQRMRRAYAATLSRSIRYQGPINQFPTAFLEKDVHSLRDEEISPEIRMEARQFYLAKADLASVSIWPRFALEKQPEHVLVNRFSAFADDFRQTTQGRVVARLRLLPRRTEEPIRFSFRLMVNNAPATQIALFTVEVVSESLLIRGLVDKPVTISTEAELDKFVQDLLNSEKLRYEIQRLLLIEEDIQRGEA